MNTTKELCLPSARLRFFPRGRIIYSGRILIRHLLSFSYYCFGSPKRFFQHIKFLRAWKMFWNGLWTLQLWHPVPSDQTGQKEEAEKIDQNAIFITFRFYWKRNSDFSVSWKEYTVHVNCTVNQSIMAVIQWQSSLH